jgi:integrase
MKLIQANLDGIERDFAKGGKREQIIFDDLLKGFGLRLQGKHRTWIIQYRIGFKQRRLTLGKVSVLSANDARKMAKDRLADVTKGHDPQLAKIEQRAATKVTLRSVVDLYLTAKQTSLRPGSLYEMRRYLIDYWTDLHKLPIDRIEQKLVAAQLREMKARGQVTAARARTALSCLFTWAMREGLCANNPVTNTNDPAEGIEPRKRVLTDDELVRVWNACLDDDYGRIIRLLILTGQRRQEVGSMGWSELNRNSGTWMIPGARSKNHQDHELTLSGAAWHIIDQVQPREGNNYLFGRKNGLAGWSDSKEVLDKRCGVKDWVLHDIRRTVATGMADIGIQPHIIEAILNHIGHKRGVAGIYNRSSYAREVKTALALWADHVASIVSGEERKIVQFAPQAG